jgi:hypothetical protein
MHDKHEAATAAMKTTITSFQQVLGGADKPTHQKKFARSLTKAGERRIVRKGVHPNRPSFSLMLPYLAENSSI